MFRLALLLLPAIVLGQAPNPHNVAIAFFDGIDADGDGSFSRADVDTYFNKYDTNNDGAVNLAEFKAYVSAAKPELADYLDAAFGVFDQNSDGKLDGDDYTAAFMAVDADGDGAANQGEFTGVFTHLFETILHPHGGPA